MKNFRLVSEDIHITPLRDQLAQHPELWDIHPHRRVAVHAEMTDIWVRYRAIEELKEPRNYREQHTPVFYPAWHTLTALHPIVFDLAQQVRATQIGGILITRIPAGGQILPHDDKGSWHAEFHNCKIYVPIATNEDCINISGHERLHMRLGEAWTFDNLVTHSVENNGDTDRMTAIICFRVEDGPYFRS